MSLSPASPPPGLPRSLLVANRGEIAIRVIRAARDLGIRTVAVSPLDDSAALHNLKADVTHTLPGRGARAYLDIDAVIAAAVATGCDAIHPGYGFLAENAAFATACADAGLMFIGPRPDVLELFGDKVTARRAAQQAGVAVLPGSDGPLDAAGAEAFLTRLGSNRAMMLKAVAGGGGRGMRVVRDAAEVAEAFARCASEATASFGNGAVFAEEYLPVARHIEVQILGDGTGAVAHLGERDCSVQRRNQKLIEIAPAPGLPAGLRARIIDAAMSLAAAVRYNNIGTFEFLVDASSLGDDSRFAFLEANPRIQVEHTVTEEVTGVDLVECQLRLAGGASIGSLNLPDAAPRGWAIQTRINLETMEAGGSATPSGGTLTAYDLPSGRGLRVDGYGYVGYTTNPGFDSLLAKLIVHRPTGTFAEAVAKAYAALCECRIEGAATNIRFLQDLLLALAPNRHSGVGVAENLASDSTVAPGDEGVGANPTLSTGFVAEFLAAGTAAADHQRRYVESAHSEAATATATIVEVPVGRVAVAAPMPGVVVSVEHQAGDVVHVGQLIVVIEAMKMEHEVRATHAGVLTAALVGVGDPVLTGQVLATLDPSGATDAATVDEITVDPDHIRADLAEIVERHRITLDAARPDAVARRRKTGQRTARENVANLVDEGTFVEYGPLTVAAQRRRRTMDELIAKSPADGMITGIGRINGDLFDDPAGRCAVLAYDYTVFAGTQGIKNHAKTDRMIHVARDGRLPLILFGEGGGGRPGEDSGDYGETFAEFAQLSGQVPMIAIVSGRCYAGNASLVGCCDVIIATKNSNIGMGGPAMIEGGGLGVFRPEEIGPIDVQVASGVVDIAVDDEVEAVQVAKQYLSYFQGRLLQWEAPDQRPMRHIIPENRLRIYDVRQVIETLADVGSVLELRRGFGDTIITAFARVEGRPFGIMANNPSMLGGAIDSDGADKGARFLQLCDTFDLPILSLVDTPGIMVGPEVEKTALVRHSSRMFLAGANLTVPTFAIILRKSYGLGGIVMSGGSFKASNFTVAWPTGEWGTMGLEGSVTLAYRNEMAAIVDPVERKKFFDDHVAAEYKKGKAVRLATGFAIDDTIDPADSRFWLANLLASMRPPAPLTGRAKKRPAVDAW